jgi:hypothetical protein
MAKTRKKISKINSKLKKRISARRIRPVLRTAKPDERPGSEEIVIAQAKYVHPRMPEFVRPVSRELPHQYEQDRIILQVRDTHWLHAYWEVRGQTLGRLKGELGEQFQRAKRMLRVYDISYINFDGSNANSFFDIQLNDHANNWYIEVSPGRSWCVDFGLLLPDGRFITILRSNVVQTPLDGASWITDEEWMIPDDMFARLYGMGFGLGRSSPVGKGWQERIKKELVSSPGVTSLASPVKIAARKFWMWVDCELIVYGATEPDAQVTVQGKPIRLRSDGTFTLRFALPDGKQTIPVKAVSADRIDQQTITPIVERDTK